MCSSGLRNSYQIFTKVGEHRHGTKETGQVTRKHQECTPTEIQEALIKRKIKKSNK
jgi:hypothetical protein